MDYIAQFGLIVLSYSRYFILCHWAIIWSGYEKVPIGLDFILFCIRFIFYSNS